MGCSVSIKEPSEKHSNADAITVKSDAEYLLFRVEMGRAACYSSWPERIMEIKQTLNRLGRSRSNQVIGGVCAGFAESTETPAWLWRAGFVFAAIGFGAGLLAYLILWWFMPLRDDATGG
jgi:phage shock protein PspC (stress-responsive transcriptional regulator)